MILFGLWLTACDRPSGPTVTILTPENGAIVPSGQTVDVLATLDLPRDGETRCTGGDAGPDSIGAVGDSDSGRHRSAMCLWIDAVLVACVDSCALARSLVGVSSGPHVVTVRAVRLFTDLGPGEWCEGAPPGPDDVGTVACELAYLSNGTEVEFTAGEADEDGDGFVIGDDCDDADAAVNPAGAEVCNGLDDDCDGVVDDGVVIPTWYPDTDTDGLGDPAAGTLACEAPEGTVSNGDDCDDGDEAIGAATTWYTDSDGDGCGDPLSAQTACEAPPGTVADSSDPDDNNKDDCTLPTL